MKRIYNLTMYKVQSICGFSIDDLLRHGLRIAMLLALFTLHCSLFISEARAQDAFYIYRNDGDFDGFFYDQVIRMGYSKFDLDSVEHDVYVVQEIETADSLYRIPLAAIDSIGFQQPEIIFSQNMRNMDEDGLTDYVDDVDDHTLFLRQDTPDDLLPKVGEVLVSFEKIKNHYFEDVSDYGEDHEFGGFGGKVVSVKRIQYGFYRVDTEKLSDISDVFQQFITVEQVGVDEQGHARRRIAGFRYDDNSRRWMPKKANGEGSIFLVDFSGSLHSDLDIGSSGSASIELGVKMKVGLNVAYNITWRRIFFKIGSSFGFGLTPGATLKTSASFDGEVVGLPRFIESIKFPAVAPLFQTRPLPKIFVRGGGDLALKLTLPQVACNINTAIIYDSDKSFPFDFSKSITGPSESGVADNVPFNTGDLELSLSGFLQIGMKFPANIETNDWISDIIQTNVSLDFFVGPKIEGSVALSASVLSNPNAAYNTLKNCQFTLHPLSLDLAATGYYKMFWSNPNKVTFFEGSQSFFPQQWNAVCAFDSLNASFNQKSQIVEAVAYPSGKTFLMNYVGLGLYDYQNQRIREYTHTSPYFIGQLFKEVNTKFDTAKLPCGTYWVRPFIKLFGYNIETDIEKQVVITPTIIIKEDSVDLNGDKHHLEYIVMTNAKTLKIGFLDDDMKPINTNGWFKPSLSEIDTEIGVTTLTVDVEANPTLWDRKGYIILTAEAGGYSASDTLLIKQAQNFQGFKEVGGSVYLNAYLKGSQDWNGNVTVLDNDDDCIEATFHMRVDPGGLSQDVPFTIQRDGDIMTVRGYLSAPIQNNKTSDDGRETKTNTNTGTVSVVWELVMDLSENHVIKLLSGSSRYSYNYHHTSQSSKKNILLEYVEQEGWSKGDYSYSSEITFTQTIIGTFSKPYKETELHFALGNSTNTRTFDQASGSSSSGFNAESHGVKYNSRGEVREESSEYSTKTTSRTPHGDRKGWTDIVLVFKDDLLQ